VKGKSLLVILAGLLFVILLAGLMVLIFTTFKLQQALKPKIPQYSAQDLGKKGEQQLAAGDYAQAEDYLKQSLQKQDDGSYRSKLAVVEYRLKKYPEAVSEYQALIAKGQDVAFAENGIGNAERDWGVGHFGDAEVAYRASFAADKGYVAAYSNLALMLSAEQKPDEALAVLAKGITATGDPQLTTLKTTLSHSV